jgi:hypothetical protein
VLKLVMTAEGNRTAPMFVCDACGEPISDANLALYLWRRTIHTVWYEAEPVDGSISLPGGGSLVDQGTFFQVHKGQCRESLIEKFGGERTYDWADMELITLFEYLLHNSGITIKEFTEYVRLHEDLSL